MRPIRLLPAIFTSAAMILSAPVFGDAHQSTEKKWAIAEFGEPLYAGGIEHFPYVNPDAPKGGSIVLSDFGSYDTLNFYVQKGEWPSSIGLIYDDLMTGSGDEIDGLYGLIAETVEYPEDKSWAVFTIREEARYHDGNPIIAQDFVHALETIKEHGRPFIQSFYEDIVSGEALSDREFKVTLATTDTMKPITIAAGLSPLPVHYWEGKDVTASTLVPPLSSGPYRIKDLDAGRSITYERVEDYWGADLPIKVGQNNFDEIRYEYYRDLTVQFEAFKAGEIDFRSEPSAKRWETEYDFDEVDSGDVVKTEIPSKSPRGMGGYFFNLKRDKFKDIRVREAIMTLYDFESDSAHAVVRPSTNGLRATSRIRNMAPLGSLRRKSEPFSSRTRMMSRQEPLKAPSFHRPRTGQDGTARIVARRWRCSRKPVGS